MIKFIRIINVFILLILLISCKPRINDYYSGFVVDELGRPIENVLVKQDIQDEYSSKIYTNKRGYFKLKAEYSGLSDLIFSKEGYLSDTIEMVWTQHGETIEYSPLITEDSSRVVLQAIGNIHIDFIHREQRMQPKLYQIGNSKYPLETIFGKWMVKGDSTMNGFIIDKNSLYILGYKYGGYRRYFNYNIYSDILTVFDNDFDYQLRGIMQPRDDNSIQITWEHDSIVIYNRYE